MAPLIGYLGMAAGTIGIFFGFFYMNTLSTSTMIVTLTTVGIAGILAFIRHFFFHKSDAKRLGWETDRPDWMFEVGFANLGFGVAGLVAAIAGLSAAALAIVLLAYALYLTQAGLLHGYRYVTGPVRSPAKLWRSCVATLVYAFMMLFFAVRALALSV
jgi:hypothetical protein